MTTTRTTEKSLHPPHSLFARLCGLFCALFCGLIATACVSGSGATAFAPAPIVTDVPSSTDTATSGDVQASGDVQTAGDAPSIDDIQSPARADAHVTSRGCSNDAGQAAHDDANNAPDTATGGSASTATGGSSGKSGTIQGSYKGRKYIAFVPASYNSATPSPVVIALHGLGDKYSNYFSILNAYGWTSAATSAGFILLVPDHSNPTRPSFLHLTGQGKLNAAAMKQELAGLLAATWHGLGAAYNVDTTKLYMIGFSEGGVVSDIAAFWHSEQLRAVAPYAGAAAGKNYPLPRDIPVYMICGTKDPGYAGVKKSFADWVNAGHTAKSAWVAGAGHKFSALCKQGPPPSSVYAWMASAVSKKPVVSGFSKGAGGGSSSGGSSSGGSSSGGSSSGGYSGAFPGDHTRTVNVAGLGTQSYLVHVPPSYKPTKATALLFTLHGAAGPGKATAAATQVRALWSQTADAGGFITVSQIATGASGGWNTGKFGAIFNAIADDMKKAYHIDNKRIHLWGFSAGGHLAHSLALHNAKYFASYAVSAGVLQSLAGYAAPSKAARKIPVAILVGTKDPLLPYAKKDVTTFQQAGWVSGKTLFFTQFPGGHTFTAAHAKQIWASINGV